MTSLLSRIRSRIRQLQHQARVAAVRDTRSLWLHGIHAPLWCQRVWFTPAECERFIKSGNRNRSGEVVGGDWDTESRSVEEIPLMKVCRLHWEHGVPWDETGHFETYEEKLRRIPSVDGCRTMDDVRARYRELDQIFVQTQREGRLLTRAELPGRSFREKGGIYLHIGRTGEPVFGGAGYHRFAIARILDLERVPAQLGMVHPEALATWKARFSTA